MDSPAPAPLEVHRPEVTPLSEEQKRNYQKDIDRFEEEKFASRNSFPTKLLSWMLIASLGLQISGAVSNNSYDFGGLVFFFVGIGILKGSQSALRFATFFAVLGAILGGLQVVRSIVAHEPLEIGGDWKDYRDLEFWTLEVSPCMYFAAESIVATCAFRLRRIPFWTKTVRRWAAIVGMLLLLKSGFAIRDFVRENEVRKFFSRDIQAAKALTSRRGSIIAGPSTLEASPLVLRIAWRQGSRYNREILYQAPPRKPSKSEKLYEYEEWVESPSGDWGKLELNVVLPKTP